MLETYCYYSTYLSIPLMFDGLVNVRVIMLPDTNAAPSEFLLTPGGSFGGGGGTGGTIQNVNINRTINIMSVQKLIINVEMHGY